MYTYNEDISNNNNYINCDNNNDNVICNHLKLACTYI